MKHEYMLKAIALAEFSKSKLAKVGAVLVKSDKIISLAFNSDMYNRLEELETEDNGKLITRPEVIHAETRCIADAARFGESTQDAQLYVTLAPCFRCATAILASGIKEVYYVDRWWDEEAIKYLKKNGVKVERMEH